MLSSALPPRALDDGCLCHTEDHLGCRHCCHSGGGDGEKTGFWVPQPYPSWSGLRGPPAWQGGSQLAELPWLDREGPQASQCRAVPRTAPQNPIVTGITVACRPQSHVLLILLLQGSLGMQAQLLQPRGWDCGHHLLSLRSYLSISSSSATFRCTDVRIS